jgi:hypothetical protein
VAIYRLHDTTGDDLEVRGASPKAPGSLLKGAPEPRDTSENGLADEACPFRAS